MRATTEVNRLSRRMRWAVPAGIMAAVGVAGVALATGAALFPIGPVTLLSGTTVPLTDGVVRLLLVALYVTAAMASTRTCRRTGGTVSTPCSGRRSGS
jgi:hypothetical protein